MHIQARTPRPQIKASVFAAVIAIAMSAGAIAFFTTEPVLAAGFALGAVHSTFVAHFVLAKHTWPPEKRQRMNRISQVLVGIAIAGLVAGIIV